MRRKILPFILGGALAIATVAPAAAAHNEQHQFARAGGLIAAVVQAQVSDVDVVVLNNSLNNLLRDADIEVLKNFLNDSEVLSRFNITITDIQILNENQVQVNILGGGSIILEAPGA